jgi:hypothetical protein
MDQFSGLDLCTTPAAQAPEGRGSNFEDRGTLASTVIGVCSVMITLALLTTLGRVFANGKQLAWSDCE